jgi:hypothetical protein
MRMFTAGDLALAAFAAVVGLSACNTTVGPTSATPRMMTTVAAPFGTTWAAVVDVFADRNIPIKTLNRSAGLIVAEPTRLPKDDASLADCGTAHGVALAPTLATWTVRVRGDSAASTVAATIRFHRDTATVMASDDTSDDCTSHGALESSFESAVKSRAQGRKMP